MVLRNIFPLMKKTRNNQNSLTSQVNWSRYDGLIFYIAFEFPTTITRPLNANGPI